MRKRSSAAFKAQLVQELLREEKSLSQLASEYGVHPNQLREWKKTALDGLPSLFEADRKATTAAAQHEQKVHELYAEIGRLTTQVAWLKKNLVSTLTRPERLALIERVDSELPLVTQAELLELSRANQALSYKTPAAVSFSTQHDKEQQYNPMMKGVVHVVVDDALKQ